MTATTDAAIALRQAAACEDVYVSPGMALILVDAADPVIRADERERVLAKVEALRDRGLGTVLRSDVLALFEEVVTK